MTIHSTKPVPDEDSLYISAPKIHPRAVVGPFRRLKTGLSGVLLLLTVLAPWLRWERAPGLPDQAILFSFTSMRAYFFGLEIWAQEFYYVTAILIIACLALFLATALYGRVWCGFTCPQTVWTDLFVWIESRVEGDRNSRLKLDRAPWGLEKILRKGIKHGLWLLVSALTGATFCFYFTDAVSGSRDLLSGRASETLYGFWAGFAAMTYILAGWMREQICTYMCPWPRLQGSMLDEHSLIVSYDSERGEDRAHAKAGQSFAGRGHCVDCQICVQVCPVGIDIRKGSQMECISCGLCVDGCNSVMSHFGLPANLIAWKPAGSNANGKTALLARPRVWIYSGLILLILILSAVAFQGRATLEIAVLPDRSPTFVHLSDGSIRNGYTLRISNQKHQPIGGHLHLEGLKDGTLSVLGQEAEGEAASLEVTGDGVETFRIFVRQSAAAVQAQGPAGTNQPVLFAFTDADDQRQASAHSSFITGGTP